MIFRPPRPVSMTLNLAPMVDVMMCLIIFFLLASRLVDAEHKPLELPFAVAARDVERGELGGRVVINVRKSGEQSEVVVNGWDGEKIVERILSPEDVVEYLQGKAAQAAEAYQDIHCVIRADKDSAYSDVEVVMRACGAAKIAHVVFSVNAGENPGGRP